MIIQDATEKLMIFCKKINTSSLASKSTDQDIILRILYRFSSTFTEHLVGPYLLQHHQEREVKVVVVVRVQCTLEIQYVWLENSLPPSKGGDALSEEKKKKAYS